MKHFSKPKKIIKKVVEPLTVAELAALIDSEKPTEIYNNQWTTTKPYIVITEYNKDGFLMFCNDCDDKIPKQYNAKKLHGFLRLTGLEDCYIK